MTDRDDIIRMAREAEEYADRVFPTLPRPLDTHWSSVRDQHFAALVAAAERKACAMHYLDILRKAVEAEREACAQICDTQQKHCHTAGSVSMLMKAACAIRARSSP